MSNLDAWINDYIGLPYLSRGRTRDGVDCLGLVILVLHDVFGVEIANYLDEYDDAEDVAANGPAFEASATTWVAVLPGAERPGDVVLLRRGKWPCHCGVVVEPGRMLHSERGADAALESYRETIWKKRVVAIYRHCDLAQTRATVRPATK